MDTERIKNCLAFLGSTVSASQNREDWLIASCVFAPWKHKKGVDNNPSFGISKGEEGIHFFHCFSCGASGDLAELPYQIKILLKNKPNTKCNTSMALKALDGLDAVVEIKIKDYRQKHIKSKGRIVIFPEHYIQDMKPAWRVPIAMNYLFNRRVSKDIAKFFDIRFDLVKKRVCFPVRDNRNRLVGLHGRDITEESKLPYLVYRYEKKSTNIVWLGEDWVDPNKTVVLVESVFDHTSVHRVYQNVLSGFACGLSRPRLERIKGLKNIITFYDHGQGGDSARLKISKILKDSNITHLVPTEQQGDPGNCTKYEIFQHLKRYLPI